MSNEFNNLAANPSSPAEELFIFITDKGVTSFEKEEQYDRFLEENYTYNSALYEHDLRYLDY